MAPTLNLCPASEYSKKWGMLFLVNDLFAIAFKLNNFTIGWTLFWTLLISPLPPHPPLPPSLQ